jgi:hypothetical protein
MVFTTASRPALFPIENPKFQSGFDYLFSQTRLQFSQILSIIGRKKHASWQKRGKQHTEVL